MRRKNKFLSTLLALTMTAGMLTGTVSTAYAEGDNEATLDLESSSTYASTQTIDQNYTLTIDNNYTDLTQVAIDWSITDIAVTRTDEKVWDPESLTWTTPDGGSGTPNVEAGTASFNLYNNSTVKVNAAVTFEVDGAFSGRENYVAPTIAYTEGPDDGSVTLAAMVYDDKMLNEDSNYYYSDCYSYIEMSVTPSSTSFGTLDATDGTKYGTYTITLSAVQPVTYALTGSSANSKELSSDKMLATLGSSVMYTYDGQTCVAYNGYISETEYANWADATTFVEKLNNDKVFPSGSTYGTGEWEGTWRLLSSYEEAQAWAAASEFDSDTKFGNVRCVYSTVEDGNSVYIYAGSNDFWGLTSKSTSMQGDGFVVVWAMNGAD